MEIWIRLGVVASFVAATREAGASLRVGVPPVEKNQARWTYPHTIDNGSGEKLIFHRRTRDAQGREMLEVSNEVGPGSGPPMHVHFRQEESLTVREGRLAWQRPGEEPHYAGPGETVTFKAGDPHRFWNAGDTLLKCDGFIAPPDNIEYFLGQIYASTKANGGHRPSTLDAAFLTDRYRSEFAMMGIPAFVRKVIMPIQLLIGRLTGGLSKFADAPEPVKD